MVCEKCNTKIEGNEVYCPNCGWELHYVPDYDEVEEELEKALPMLGEDEAQMPFLEEEQEMEGDDDDSGDNDDNEDNEEEDDEWEEFHLERQETALDRKVKLIARIVGLSSLILALVVGVVCYAVIENRSHSYQVQYKKALKYEKNGDYSKAVRTYENALSVAKEKDERLEASKSLGMLYAENEDTKNAVYYLEMAVENDASDVDAVTTLVRLYELQGNSEAIKKLAKIASNEKTESLFEKYLLNQPIFNYKSGTYNEYLTVEITSNDNETIHYTLDDSTATVESAVYTDPIQVTDGTTVIHAITVNQNNLVSEEVIVTYAVRSSAFMTPVMKPESGEFTEMTKVVIENIPANCKTYYTTDGTEPSEKSAEYTEAFDMPVGNHVIKAVSINTVTGARSQVVSKVYNLNTSDKYNTGSANAMVFSALQSHGETINAGGTQPDGSSCVLQFEEAVDIGGSNYYIMHRYTMSGDSLTDTGTYYAVNLSTGDVFLAVRRAKGIYNLDAF